MDLTGGAGTSHAGSEAKPTSALSNDTEQTLSCTVAAYGPHGWPEQQPSVTCKNV